MYNHVQDTLSVCMRLGLLTAGRVRDLSVRGEAAAMVMVVVVPGSLARSRSLSAFSAIITWCIGADNILIHLLAVGLNPL